MKLIVISGLSGAGKSVALHTLEDEGFQCIDNLPLEIFEYMIGRMTQAPPRPDQKTAICIDVRSLAQETSRFIALLGNLKSSKQVETNLVFIEANTETLIRRYNETRRPHPLGGADNTLQKAIAAEIAQLAEILHHADITITTTGLNQHQLRRQIRMQVCAASTRLFLTLQSFGFKHAIPANSNHVFDVSCLPNPYWEPHLRELTGKDPRVRGFLEKHQECLEMLDAIATLISRWLPKFVAAGRKNMTVSVGCTGGQHRSVYMVERLYQSFQENPYCSVEKRHNNI